MRRWTNGCPNFRHQETEHLANACSPGYHISNLLVRSPDVEKIEIYFKWSIISADAEDNKFVDCALNGRAEYLVTDDRHYNILNTIGFPLVKVIRTASFLDIVKKL
jgi:predicted nucleic acid-binding protein